MKVKLWIHNIHRVLKHRYKVTKQLSFVKFKCFKYLGNQIISCLCPADWRLSDCARETLHVPHLHCRFLELVATLYDKGELIGLSVKGFGSQGQGSRRRWLESPSAELVKVSSIQVIITRLHAVRFHPVVYIFNWIWDKRKTTLHLQLCTPNPVRDDWSTLTG